MARIEVSRAQMVSATLRMVLRPRVSDPLALLPSVREVFEAAAAAAAPFDLGGRRGEQVRLTGFLASIYVQCFVPADAGLCDEFGSDTLVWVLPSGEVVADVVSSAGPMASSVWVGVSRLRVRDLTATITDRFPGFAGVRVTVPAAPTRSLLYSDAVTEPLTGSPLWPECLPLLEIGAG